MEVSTQTKTQLSIGRLIQSGHVCRSITFPAQFYILDQQLKNIICSDIGRLFVVNNSLYPVQRACFVHLSKSAKSMVLRNYCDFVLRLDLSEWDLVAQKCESSDAYNEFEMYVVTLEAALI